MQIAYLESLSIDHSNHSEDSRPQITENRVVKSRMSVDNSSSSQVTQNLHGSRRIISYTHHENIPVRPSTSSSNGYFYPVFTTFCSFLRRIKCYRWRKLSSTIDFSLEAGSLNMAIFLKKSYKLQSVYRAL